MNCPNTDAPRESFYHGLGRWSVYTAGMYLGQIRRTTRHGGQYFATHRPETRYKTFAAAAHGIGCAGRAHGATHRPECDKRWHGFAAPCNTRDAHRLGERRESMLGRLRN